MNGWFLQILNCESNGGVRNASPVLPFLHVLNLVDWQNFLYTVHANLGGFLE